MANVCGKELAFAIAHVLSRPDCKLEVLDMRVVGSYAVGVFAGAIRCNTSLSKIAVDWACLSEEDQGQLATALRNKPDSKLELILLPNLVNPEDKVDDRACFGCGL